MTKPSYKITFDAPEAMDISEVLERIVEEVASDEESGQIDDAGHTIRWSMRQTGGGITIDRRQRLAAAALLMGFNLPQEMHAAAITMMDAAEVCPGMTTGDMADMGPQGRRSALEMARRLIDEMLAEPDTPVTKDDA